MERCGDTIVDVGESCDDGNDNPWDRCDACGLVAFDTRLITGAGGTGGDPARLEPTGTVRVAATGRDVVFLDATKAVTVDVDAVLGGRLPAFTPLIGTGVEGAVAVGSPGPLSPIPSPCAGVVDGLGQFIFGSAVDHRVWRIEGSRGRAGLVRRIAGSGLEGDFQNGDAALGTPLTAPCGLDVNTNGDVLIVDTATLRVGVLRNGLIRHVAGTGLDGVGIAGDEATESDLSVRSAAFADGGLLLAVEDASVVGGAGQLWQVADDVLVPVAALPSAPLALSVDREGDRVFVLLGAPTPAGRRILEIELATGTTREIAVGNFVDVDWSTAHGALFVSRTSVPMVALLAPNGTETAIASTDAF